VKPSNARSCSSQGKQPSDGYLIFGNQYLGPSCGQGHHLRESRR